VAEPERVDVLQFMSLRQASTVDDVTWQLDFIHDDGRRSGRDGVRRSSADLAKESPFVEMVVHEVFCTGDWSDQKLVQKVLDETRRVTVDCTNGKGPTGLLALEQLELAHRFSDGSFRILPDRLATALDAADADLLMP
jgi:hypothetical protein